MVMRRPFEPSVFPIVVPITATGPIYSVLYCELDAWFTEQGIDFRMFGYGLETTFHFRDTTDASVFKMWWL